MMFNHTNADVPKNSRHGAVHSEYAMLENLVEMTTKRSHERFAKTDKERIELLNLKLKTPKKKMETVVHFSASEKLSSFDQPTTAEKKTRRKW